jgi:hypothetical protein
MDNSRGSAAKHVSTLTFKLICDRGRERVKSDRIVYFDVKVCHYNGSKNVARRILIVVGAQ